jgi:hypothetical protein
MTGTIVKAPDTLKLKMVFVLASRSSEKVGLCKKEANPKRRSASRMYLDLGAKFI